MSRPSPGDLILAVVLVAAAAGLAALIFLHARTLERLQTKPSTALAVAPHDPRALSAEAGMALAQARTPATLARAAELAREALRRDPLDEPALRDLGVIAAVGGDLPVAHRRLALAGAHTPLDIVTELWLVKYDLMTKDYAGAVAHADDLMRHDPDHQQTVFPYLAYAAALGRGALVARLATAPPWREAFLTYLAAQARDPAVPFALLEGLAAGPAPPTPPEVGAFLARRMRDHDYAQAYLDWLLLLPHAALAHALPVYDGNFDGLPGPEPFNWTLGQGVGGEAAMGPSPSGAGHALHVSYDGYSTPSLAEQTLVLDPGPHLLAFQVLSQGAAGGLAWTLACVGAPATLLAQVPVPDAAAGWRAASGAFTVPATACPAQILRLKPIPADHQRPVEAWFRGLAVTDAAIPAATRDAH